MIVRIELTVAPGYVEPGMAFQFQLHEPITRIAVHLPDYREELVHAELVELLDTALRPQEKLEIAFKQTIWNVHV